MKRHLVFRALFVAIAASLALALVALPRRGAQAGAALKTVIVELKGEPALVAKYRAEAAGQAFDVAAYRRELTAAQDNLLARARAAGIDYVLAGVNAPNGEVTAPIQFRFNYVYNGVTLEVPDAAVPAIEKLDGVAAVHEAETMYPHLDRAVSYVRASDLYGSPARTSPFDTLDTGGVHGEGMIAAVIDTGIDWTHPMFGGDPTPPQFGVGPALATRNQKVIYYLNLTAGAVQDDFGHGTHVAAALAGYGARAPGADMIPGTADDVTIHGIAPQAKLMGYKTLSTVGTGLNPSTIMAIEDAVQPFTITGYPKPVPHVINLSLGSTVNDPNSPTSVACDNATLAGVTVVASAGNSGAATAENPTGEATIGSPGTGRRVLTVGANNDPGFSEDIVMDRVYDSGRPNDLTDVLDPAGVSRSTTGFVDATNKTAAAGQRTGIQTVIAGGSPTIGNAVAQYYVFAGTVTTAADVPDAVAGRIAIARPSGAFAGAAAAIAAKGAAGALIIRPDLAKITVGHSTIPVWSITESDARYLLDLLASNDAPGVDPAKGVVSEFPVRIKQGTFTPAMASFSSKGPVGGYGQVKPDVTATGVGILSATVRAGGVSPSPSFMFHPSGYVSASGTSMSSPVTAGVATLVKQKNPQWTPAMVRAALVNTATNLRRADGSPVADGRQSVNDQGGGLIDARAAANAPALMGTGTPGPSGKAPAVRANQICPAGGVLCGASPGNPDFSAGYSFGEVRIAGVEGTATHTLPVNIIDVRNGAGAGTYELSSSYVRGADGSNFRVKFTDAGGSEISSVEVPAGGTASFNVTTVAEGGNIQNGSQIQFYVSATPAGGGQRLRMPFYYRAASPVLAGAAAPQLGSVGGTEVAGTPATDVNGAYELNWGAPASGPQPSKYRVQESQDGGATWATLADVPASQTTTSVKGRGNGTYQYRVVGLFAVEYGLTAGPESAAQSVRVERRVEQDVTALVEAAIVDGTLTFTNGVTEFDQTLRNNSSSSLYAPLQFVITSVQSNSGRVAVANADNGGAGTSASPAAFNYSAAAGDDFAAGETSGAKRLRFTNPGSELFRVTAVVRAHAPDPAYAGGTATQDPPPSGTSSGSTSGSGTGTVGGLPLPTGQGAVLTLTVNPLTRTVSAKLVRLL
ncbi:MAG TPA: S8 family serine peptidase [Pyrinomonadaceae bacterium]|jgi:subtilisin family serine protease|nr:S8 family serine peptidase [Pyrinomonadaceae bacterium]